MSAEHAVTVDDALELLDVIPDYDAGSGPGPCVHTFLESAVGLLGAHWYLTDLESHMRRYGVEGAGPAAAASGHGLVVVEPGRGPLFLATRQTVAA